MMENVHRQEQTANNLANANTVGYKRERMFSEVLGEWLDAEGAPRSDRDLQRWADATHGPLEQTGNPLDVALNGDGFFVLTDKATGDARYTRAGRFVLDQDGVLRDAAGRLVEGENGPIRFSAEPGTIEITTDGEIRADDDIVGRLRVVTFDDPTQLDRAEGSLFMTEAAPQAPDDVQVRQGYLESSNVDVIQEMTGMISQFRLFESQQKVIQTLDQVLGQTTRDLGKF